LLISKYPVKNNKSSIVSFTNAKGGKIFTDIDDESNTIGKNIGDKSIQN